MAVLGTHLLRRVRGIGREKEIGDGSHLDAEAFDCAGVKRGMCLPNTRCGVVETVRDRCPHVEVVCALEHRQADKTGHHQCRIDLQAECLAWVSCVSVALDPWKDIDGNVDTFDLYLGPFSSLSDFTRFPPEVLRSQ